MPILNFLKYHNAVPIAASILVLGAGATFAATDPGAIYSAQQQVLSVDNTYLVNKDLSVYTPSIQITGVTEDDTSYYVAYEFHTIDVQDYVWRDVVNHNVITTPKEALGRDRDLGVYVTKLFSQIIDHEVDRLQETQKIARGNISQKVVATTYGGLVGKLLDDKTETLPGYTPVVAEAPASGETQVASASAVDLSSQSAPAQPSGPGPTIQVLGNNPARIPLHSSYVDLGAVITGQSDSDRALGIHVFLNDVEVPEISVDTAATSTLTIRYRATNTGGATGSAERTVVVYDPNEAPTDSSVQ